MNTISSTTIDRWSARAAGKMAFTIDAFICDRMETQDPLAFWIFSKKIFRNRFVARILGLRIDRKQVERGEEIVVYCRGRKIGTMLMLKPSFV